MSFDEIAIRVTNVSKHYAMFERPEDRLKQMVQPRLARLLGRERRQYYRDFAALNGVSFEIRRGETVGIIGRNGCGKSTLLQIVCGTLQPTSGSVEVNGRIAALLELGAGFNPEFTGRENVYMNAAILGLTQDEIDTRFDAIARFADIGIFIDQPVKTYSSGMYVRLAFAVAINVDPDILVVDEALSVGDEAFQRKCFARIEDIKSRGATILFVSHGAQTIVQLCDRAILMDRGEKILEGRPKTVVSQYQRLVNTSAEGAGEIRAAIIAMRDAQPDVVAPLDGARHLDASTTGNGVTASDDHPADAEAETSRPAASIDYGLADYYDPNLQSQSTIHLEERGARIRDVRITTLDGKPVNVLRTGKRYVFEYQVDFTESAKNIGCGISLKNTAGTKIAGVMTTDTKGYSWKSVAHGNSLHVAFEFSCLLNVGSYFVSCGVLGTVGDQQLQMHRIMDALLIRVASDFGLVLNGLVDLSFVPSIALAAH